jgi:hypothetical protein
MIFDQFIGVGANVRGYRGSYLFKLNQIIIVARNRLFTFN